MFGAAGGAARLPGSLPAGLTASLLPAQAPPTQADAHTEGIKRTIPLGRVGAPEEAAGAALMLASPYSSYISGQIVEVTGGGWL